MALTGLPSKIDDTGFHACPSFLVRHTLHEPVNTVEVSLGSRVRYTIQTPFISCWVSGRLNSCIWLPWKRTKPINCHVTHICDESVGSYTIQPPSPPNFSKNCAGCPPVVTTVPLSCAPPPYCCAS